MYPPNSPVLTDPKSRTALIRYSVFPKTVNVSSVNSYFFHSASSFSAHSMMRISTAHHTVMAVPTISRSQITLYFPSHQNVPTAAAVAKIGASTAAPVVSSASSVTSVSLFFIACPFSACSGGLILFVACHLQPSAVGCIFQPLPVFIWQCFNQYFLAIDYDNVHNFRHCYHLPLQAMRFRLYLLLCFLFIYCQNHNPEQQQDC